MEALGGVGKFVVTADVGHTASVPTDVITTSAILKEGMKKKTHGCEPQGCAPELCQCSVCSRAALAPLQAWVGEGHRAVYELGALHCPYPLHLQPSSVPALYPAHRLLL